jgi:hypothetical protein
MLDNSISRKISLNSKVRLLPYLKHIRMFSTFSGDKEDPKNTEKTEKPNNSNKNKNKFPNPNTDPKPNANFKAKSKKVVSDNEKVTNYLDGKIYKMICYTTG